MDRMAKHPSQPEMLRELFDELGNDPLVVAECLARPISTERLVADLSIRDKTRCFDRTPNTPTRYNTRGRNDARTS